MKISKIPNVKVLGSVFAAQNNRLKNGEWVENPYSKKEKEAVKKYLINQQYSADLGLDHGNFGNTVSACREAYDSTVKVVCVTYLKNGFAKSVAFVGHIESCHHNLQIGSSAILNIIDQHYTQVSKPFVKIFQEVYGEICHIAVADIKIDKNTSPLMNAVNIEAFRYASQWRHYDYSNPKLTWEEAVEAFSHL